MATFGIVTIDAKQMSFVTPPIVANPPIPPHSIDVTSPPQRSTAGILVPRGTK